MKRQLLIAASALALLAGACGDDGGDSAGEAASEAREAAGEAAEQLEEAASEAGEAASEAGERAGDAAAEGVDPSETGDVAEGVVGELRPRGLNTVASAIEAIGIDRVIQSETFTLFAPSDEAFLSLDPGEMAALLSDPERARQILRDHVLDEEVSSAELSGMSEVTTSSGATVPVSAQGDTTTIGGATVTEADVEVGGGVIHVVDAIVSSDAGATGS